MGSPGRRNASHWCPVSSHPPIPTRVVLLAGPSGSGKSSLAARSGPARAAPGRLLQGGDDPTLPRGRRQYGHRLGLLAVLGRGRRGRRDRGAVPYGTYPRTPSTTSPPAHGWARRRSTSSARPCSSRRASSPPTSWSAAGNSACSPTRCACAAGPSTTFRRRLLRDLQEGRKSVPFLLRRGWRLMRSERAIVARQTALGRAPVRQGGGPGPAGRGRGGALREGPVGAVDVKAAAVSRRQAARSRQSSGTGKTPRPSGPAALSP